MRLTDGGNGGHYRAEARAFLGSPAAPHAVRVTPAIAQTLIMVAYVANVMHGAIVASIAGVVVEHGLRDCRHSGEACARDARREASHVNSCPARGCGLRGTARISLVSVPCTRLMIFAWPGICPGAIGLSDIAGLRDILRDFVAGILALVGGDRVQLIGLLGVDRLGRALPRTSGQQAEADGNHDGQADSHFIPRLRWLRVNARAAIWAKA